MHFIKKILPTEFCIHWLKFWLNLNQGHFCTRRTRLVNTLTFIGSDSISFAYCRVQLNLSVYVFWSNFLFSSLQICCWLKCMDYWFDLYFVHVRRYLLWCRFDSFIHCDVISICKNKITQSEATFLLHLLYFVSIT